jgi:hypothetical protein
MPTFVQDERLITYFYCEYAQVYYLEYEFEQGTQIIQAMTLSGLKQLFRQHMAEQVTISYVLTTSH